MSEIHPTAIVDPGAELGANVRIGPYCVIGAGVTIGDDCELKSHVVVEGNTSIGESCRIFPFASIGQIPQDMKYKGEASQLIVGSHNVIREYVTMNSGTEGGGGKTVVGSHGLYMANSHVAHDCIVGDHVIMANCATLGGHVTVEDYAIFGGLSAAHQFTRIGAHAFIGGVSGVRADVIPYGIANGDFATLQGINIVGLRRRGVEREQIHNLRKAYRLLFATEGTFQERLDDVEAGFPDDPHVSKIVAFIRDGTDRALCLPSNSGS